MGVEWRAIKVDPLTRTHIAGEEAFDPGNFDMREIDLLLVGKLEGPIMGMMIDPGDGDGGENEEEPDSDSAESPVAFFPPEVVRRCADRLAAVPPGEYAPRKKVVRKWFRNVSRSDEEECYSDLIETTESLRKYIQDAAARGYALEFWVEGA